MKRFGNSKSRLELNDREQKNASARHNEIRDHLRAHFALDDDFLTGSYKRYTKTKPLKDVDIFCVLGSNEQHYGVNTFESAGGIPEEARGQYGANAVAVQRRSVCVDFGVVVDAEDNTDHRVVSMDVVPAFTQENTMRYPTRMTGIGSRPIRPCTKTKL